MILTEKEFKVLTTTKEKLEIFECEGKHGLVCGKYIFWFENTKVEDLIKAHQPEKWKRIQARK